MDWIQRNHFICVHVLYKSLCVKFKSYGKTLKQISSAIISNLLLVIDILFKSIPFHINNLLCANKNVSSYVITYTVQELCQTIWKIFVLATMHVEMLSWFVFISWQVWQDHRSNIPYLNSLICPVPLSVQLSIPLFHKFLVVSVDKFCSLCMKMSRISQYMYWKSHRKNCMLEHDLSCKYNHRDRLITAIKSLHHTMFLLKKYSCYSLLYTGKYSPPFFFVPFALVVSERIEDLAITNV